VIDVIPENNKLRKSELGQLSMPKFANNEVRNTVPRKNNVRMMAITDIPFFMSEEFLSTYIKPNINKYTAIINIPKINPKRMPGIVILIGGLYKSIDVRLIIKIHIDEKKNTSASFEAKHLWVNAHKPVNNVIPFKIKNIVYKSSFLINGVIMVKIMVIIIRNIAIFTKASLGIL
jgi:hypothetical protein